MPRIDEFLREMVSSGASDLHMLPGFPPLLRLRGDLEPTEHDTLSAETNEQLLFEMLTPEQQEKLKANLQLDRAYEVEGVARFRCNYFYQRRGLSAVFRHIPTQIKSLQELQ
ncbi:MAG: type IV pili twitching motility protein PilT, partial [Deltaproteobacteria bacterium]